MTKAAGGRCIFTFDDCRNIDAWYDALNLFDNYQAKVVFFINSPDRLDDAQWEKLSECRQRGHQIGCHGWRHEKAVDYCRSHGVAAWMEREVLNCQRLLSGRGFSSDFFAYPCSQHSTETDDALRSSFTHVRAGVFPKKGQPLTEMNELFTPSDMFGQCFLIPSVSIDGLEDSKGILPVIKRVGKRSETVVFYGHRIGVPDAVYGRAHTTTVPFLRGLLEAARSEGVEIGELP